MEIRCRTAPSPENCSSNQLRLQLSHRQDRQQRTLLAQTTARLIAEGGLRDLDQARRKAAAQLHLGKHCNMPSNEEVSAALREYQRLYHGEQQQQHLAQLRHTAMQAMQQLSRFRPKITGPVLDGWATSFTPITLHLFADNTEQVAMFLLQLRIPFDQEERWVNYGKGQRRSYPMLRFMADENEIELIIFTPDSPRQPPLDPFSGKVAQRRGMEQLEPWSGP